ncbi:MAG: hypothetical protein JWM27_1819, partial [Gemmatimonadetes bacterium]|nr:hypothetical protein [Gemmatimonadota bacterium]
STARVHTGDGIRPWTIAGPEVAANASGTSLPNPSTAGAPATGSSTGAGAGTPPPA